MNLTATTAEFAEADARASFIRKTYAHLAGAIALFVALEYILLPTSFAYQLANFVYGGRFGFMILLGAFILVGWMGRSLAQRATTSAGQYGGLALYVVAEAIIFLPILLIATLFSSPGLIQNAATLTAFLFGGLSLVCFTTQKDFSFLRSILMMGGAVALGLIVTSFIFGFTLGLAFSAAMILLACGAILYDTSKIMHHYPIGSHVAASLELFASVAMLFWYVLRLLMRLRR